MESMDVVVKTEALHRRVIGGMRLVGGFVLVLVYRPVGLGCEARIAASDGLCGGCLAG